MDCLTNREAEKAIIGLAMQDYACAVQLSALADDFFSAADTKALHRAVRRCLSENVTPELITLSAQKDGLSEFSTSAWKLVSLMCMVCIV